MIKIMLILFFLSIFSYYIVIKFKNTCYTMGYLVHFASVSLHNLVQAKGRGVSSVITYLEQSELLQSTALSNR